MTVNEWAEDFKSFVNELQMPRDDYNGIMEYIDDAIVLLKEQEAVSPKYIDGKLNHFIKCGKCNTDLMRGMKYCPQCGKKVKWE